MGEVEGKRMNLIYDEFEFRIVNPPREVSGGNMSIRESREREKDLGIFISLQW